MSEPIPVTIITGFLGAGKSTLVQRWLEELPRGEAAVIVNERGDVGIDGELLAARVAELREITGGCVCCKTQAELASALEELSSSSPRPRRILVETSGAASPSGVIRAVVSPRARERLVLDGVITVLDVVRAKRALEFDVTVEQLGFADVVVLSHVDEAAGVDVAAVENSLSRYAPGAVRVRASRGETSTPFLDLLAQRAETLHVVAEGSGHSSIEAISLVLDGELDDDRFGDWIESALGDVEARILRLKGILAMEGLGVRVILQGVSESVQVLMGAPWGDAPRTSRLVILGLGLDAAALEAGFKRCAAGS